jgi:hypothetical protein
MYFDNLTVGISPVINPSTGSLQARSVKYASERTVTVSDGGLISTISGLRVFVRILKVIDSPRHRKYWMRRFLKYLR